MAFHERNRTAASLVRYIEEVNKHASSTAATTCLQSIYERATTMSLNKRVEEASEGGAFLVSFSPMAKHSYFPPLLLLPPPPLLLLLLFPSSSSSSSSSRLHCFRLSIFGLELASLLVYHSSSSFSFHQTITFPARGKTERKKMQL